MFELNFVKILVLGVIALIVFGPERLPAMAAQAGRAMRELRKYLEGAKSELRENLGPEFSNLDIADLNPKHFVRKHLVDEFTGDGVITGAVRDVRNAATITPNGSPAAPAMPVSQLAAGESPPYDIEAT
ncbi:MAG: Sec-independent protein translocase subunit TatB [Actinobacteria bacterium]|nr:Sec-independent protein translocase subunit TatB [Actinomycetota bacterium]